MILPKGPSLSLQIFQLEPDTKCSFVMYVSPMRTTDRQCSHDALAVCMKCEAPLCVLHMDQCERCHEELCQGCYSLHLETCGAMTADEVNEMRLDQADDREREIGLPSASDLDSVSQEEKVREATGGKQ